MHSMAEWYMRGEPHDQVRLSRILDVAQDLKVIPHMHYLFFIYSQSDHLSYVTVRDLFP